MHGLSIFCIYPYNLPWFYLSAVNTKRLWGHGTVLFLGEFKLPSCTVGYEESIIHRIVFNALIFIAGFFFFILNFRIMISH